MSLYLIKNIFNTNLIAFHLIILVVGASCTTIGQLPSQQEQQVTERNNQTNHSLDKIIWWKRTNFYHVYLRSFKDSNDDGNGDLQGLIEKLDYLKMIGVETLLLGPIYESPMDDGGYDVTNHTEIDPMFGTMADFDKLMIELKKRQIRIVMDFVPNHVSNQHRWFNCSQRALVDVAECGRYKDYFIWNNSTRFEGKYPTNWRSVFGDESMWTWNEARKSFYLHQFKAQQPDVNWENPMIVEEFKEIARFWLRKGIDGFRIDAAGYLFEDTEFWRDKPVNKLYRKPLEAHYKLTLNFTFLHGKTLQTLGQMSEFIKKEFGPDKLSLSESYLVGYGSLNDYLGSSASKRYSDLAFNFELLQPQPQLRRPEAQDFAHIIGKAYNVSRSLNWSNVDGAIDPSHVWVLDSHDLGRRANVFGENLLIGYYMMGFLLPGSPVTYYGDEIGMDNANPLDTPRQARKSVYGANPRRIVSRALMAWQADGPSGGFSNRIRRYNWMSMAQNYYTNNVKTMLIDAKRTKNALQTFINLQELRRRHMETLVFGDFLIHENTPNYGDYKSNVFVFSRFHESHGSLLFAVNMSPLYCEYLAPVRRENDKPTIPDEAKVLLLNYIRNSTMQELCDDNSESLLHEDKQVNLRDGLKLGPDQAIILAF